MDTLILRRQLNSTTPSDDWISLTSFIIAFNNSRMHCLLKLLWNKSPREAVFLGHRNTLTILKILNHIVVSRPQFPTICESSAGKALYSLDIIVLTIHFPNRTKSVFIHISSIQIIFFHNLFLTCICKTIILGERTRFQKKDVKRND